MYRLRKIMRTVLSAVLLAGLLAGCGGTTTQTATSAPAAGGTAVETEGSEAAAAQTDKTLRLAWTGDIQTMDVHKNDPDNFIYTFYGTPAKSKLRSLNYYNTEVMDRVVAARAIVDDETRLAEYAALEKQIVQDDAAWVPLFSRTHLFVTGDRVAEYVPHWAGYSDFAFSGVTLK